MGSDDLFRKRQSAAKTTKIKRTQKSRYLIVCEGTKSEPNYLREMMQALEINPKLIVLKPNNGTSPSSIVNHAKTIYDSETEDRYDRVYCVFDRDQHTDFTSALETVKNFNDQNIPFVAITSNPCFEFWILLHFNYSSAAYRTSGTKSVGDQALSNLKKIPGFGTYSKGLKGLYQMLGEERLDTAKTNALRLRQEMSVHSNGQFDASANPWTNFDELIQAIQDWPERTD